MRASLLALITQSTLVRGTLAFIGRADDTLLTVRGNPRLLLPGRLRLLLEPHGLSCAPAPTLAAKVTTAP